jgi:hypothetical protein
MTKSIFVCFVVLLFLSLECSAGQLTGTVKSKSGNALKNVRVYSRAESQFAALDNFLTTTDEQGRFKLLTHGKIVFFRFLGFQPLVKILEGNPAHIDVVLESTQDSAWQIPACPSEFDPEAYIGMGKLGYKLLLPSAAPTSKSKDSQDFYYTVFYRQQPNEETLTYYWNWTALGFPKEELILSSGEFSIRSFSHGKYGGLDVSGRAKNGKRWRFVGIDGTEISYEHVSKEAADYFDRIINGMCVKQ